MVVSMMVPCEEQAWKAILPRVEDTGCDGIELNFGCPHGMSERGMGSAVGQVPEYIEMVTRWCKQYTRLPVIVKLTPNITDIKPPGAGGAPRRRRCGVADQHHQLGHGRRPRRAADLPEHRRHRLARRLLRPGGQADRAEHGGRDRARAGDGRPADLRHRRHRHLARRGRVHRARRRQRAGLHRGDDLRLQDRRGDERRPRRIHGREGLREHRGRSAAARCPRSSTGTSST